MESRLEVPRRDERQSSRGGGVARARVDVEDRRRRRPAVPQGGVPARSRAPVPAHRVPPVRSEHRRVGRERWTRARVRSEMCGRRRREHVVRGGSESAEARREAPLAAAATEAAGEADADDGSGSGSRSDDGWELLPEEGVDVSLYPSAGGSEWDARDGNDQRRFVQTIRSRVRGLYVTGLCAVAAPTPPPRRRTDAARAPRSVPARFEHKPRRTISCSSGCPTACCDFGVPWRGPRRRTETSRSRFVERRARVSAVRRGGRATGRRRRRRRALARRSSAGGTSARAGYGGGAVIGVDRRRRGPRRGGEADVVSATDSRKRRESRAGRDSGDTDKKRRGVCEYQRRDEAFRVLRVRRTPRRVRSLVFFRSSIVRASIAAGLSSKENIQSRVSPSIFTRRVSRRRTRRTTTRRGWNIRRRRRRRTRNRIRAFWRARTCCTRARGNRRREPRRV